MFCSYSYCWLSETMPPHVQKLTSYNVPPCYALTTSGITTLAIKLMEVTSVLMERCPFPGTQQLPLCKESRVGVSDALCSTTIIAQFYAQGTSGPVRMDLWQPPVWVARPSSDPTVFAALLLPASPVLIHRVAHWLHHRLDASLNLARSSIVSTAMLRAPNVLDVEMDTKLTAILDVPQPHAL